MDSKKMKVADFAILIGCSQKTIYKLIENNQLNTVNDIQNGRKILLIITDDTEIHKFQKIYGNLPVNEGNYKEILTDNNSENMVNENKITSNAEFVGDIFNKIFEANNQYNNQLMKFNEKFLSVNEELITYKSKIPLLEDKASREGLYLNEIKEIKNSKKILFIWLISVIIFLFILLTISSSLLINNLIHNNKNSIQSIQHIPSIEKNLPLKK